LNAYKPTAGATTALDVRLELSRCLDGDGSEIACPPVRVKVPDAFVRFNVSGDAIDLCVAGPAR